MQEEKEVTGQIHLGLDEKAFLEMLEKVTGERDQREEQCRELEEKLQNVQGKFAGMQEILLGAQKEVKILQTKLEDTQKELDSKYAESESIRRQNDELIKGKEEEAALQKEKVENLQHKNHIFKWCIFILAVLAVAGGVGSGICFAGLNQYKNDYYFEERQRTEAEQGLKQIREDYAKLQETYGKLQETLKSENSQRVAVEQELEEVQNAVSQMESDYNDLDNAYESLQDKFEKVSGLDGLYGYGSDDYYAEKSVVVLKEGETRKLNIYSYLNATIICGSTPDAISCKWNSNVIDHKAELQITARDAGIYTVEFTNKKNSDAFEILVIVRE